MYIIDVFLTVWRIRLYDHFCIVNGYNAFGLWRTFWVLKRTVFVFNAYESFIERSSLLLFLHSFTVVVTQDMHGEAL